MNNAEKTLSLLKELDDYGSHYLLMILVPGFSSLSYLKRLPVDTIKNRSIFCRIIGRRQRQSCYYFSNYSLRA